MTPSLMKRQALKRVCSPALVSKKRKPGNLSPKGKGRALFQDAEVTLTDVQIETRINALYCEWRERSPLIYESCTSTHLSAACVTTQWMPPEWSQQIGMDRSCTCCRLSRCCITFPVYLSLCVCRFLPFRPPSNTHPTIQLNSRLLDGTEAPPSYGNIWSKITYVICLNLGTGFQP